MPPQTEQEKQEKQERLKKLERLRELIIQRDSMSGNAPIAQASERTEDGFLRDSPTNTISSGSPEISATPISARGDSPESTFDNDVNRTSRDFVKQLPGALGGVVDAAATLATGIITEPASGFLGAGATAIDALIGGEDPLKRGADVQKTISDLNVFPISERGKETAAEVFSPLTALAEASDKAGNVVLDKTDSPALATLTKTVLEAVPMAFGARKKGSRTMSERTADVDSATNELSNLGLKISDPIVRQRGQLVESAKELGGQTQRAEGIGDVQRRIQGRRTGEEAVTNNRYNQARAIDADISTSQVTDLQGIISERLKNRVISTETTPATMRIIDKLDEIASGDLADPVSIRRLNEFRIQNNAVRNSKDADNSAITVINDSVAAFLREQATLDFIRGDAAAVAKWEEAFRGTESFKEMFDTNKVMKDLSTNLEATPEMAKQWIFNANSVNAKPQAGAVVKRIGEVIGKDSPEYGMLRQEVLFDILEPLLKEEPNFKSFANNYDKFVRNNPTLERELFPDSATEMLTLRRFVSSLERGSAQGLDLNLNQTLSRMLFGHEIAKSAVKVNIGTQLMNLVRSTVGKSPKQRILSEFVGYDINKPLLPKSPVAIGAGVQTGIDQQEQQQ